MSVPSPTETPKGKMKPKLAQKLKYEQLMEYTDNFSEENFLGTFQFGEVYRGVIKQCTLPTRFVMVKIWEDTVYTCYSGDNDARVMLEVGLLGNERLKSHPGMIQLYGYCWDNERLGVVYDFNPLDTLHNLVPKDSFTWLQRIKVAIGFGRLLKFLHTGHPAYKPFLVRNIAAAHIVVDKESNPKLFDFSMISGGIFPDRTVFNRYYLNGCYGYIDVYTAHSAEWSDKTDVFAFGVLLLNLIAKRVFTEEDRYAMNPTLDTWAWKLIQPHDLYSESDDNARANIKPVRSLVHQSLAMDSDFCFADGRKITKLAMKCLYTIADQRLTMKQVMKDLSKLQVVKKHAEFLELGSEIQPKVMASTVS